MKKSVLNFDVSQKNNTQEVSSDSNNKTSIKNENNVSITKASDYNKPYSSNFSPKFGNPEGKVSVVMFIDFECPFCNQEYAYLRGIMNKYKDYGYFEFRNIPITTIHPNAQKLANIAMCANNQGKFWEMFDELFLKYNERQSLVDEVSIGKAYYNYGVDIGLDMNKFTNCYNNKLFDKVVNKDILDALDYGVNSTPTFFINGNKTQGVLTSQNWEDIFSSSIEKSK